MSFKTNLTLAYINQYCQKNNIQLPKDIDLASIFKECDKYDEEGNEVENGDGILQIDEIGTFLDKVRKYSSQLGSQMYKCVKEVWDKQKQEELEAKQELLNNPPKAYDDNGIGEEGMNYVMEKLDSLGIGIEKLDLDKLVDIMARFDYDIDPNSDSKISVKEADSFYSPEYANKYMNKDSNGKTIDTHVLDWIVNNYLEETKPEQGI